NSKEFHELLVRRGIGYISNVEVINYTAYQKSQNPNLISGTVSKNGTLHKVTNVRFKNLVIEGKLCLSAEDAGIILAPTELPQDPNMTAKELASIRDSITLSKPLVATENIKFEK
ncbi:MAG TPA: hypothetical protein VF476_03955, partial [Chitinophagaceae bacterium]